MRTALFGFLALTVVMSGCLDLSDEHYRFDCLNGSCADGGEVIKADAGPKDAGVRDAGMGRDGGCVTVCLPAGPVCTDHTTLLTTRTRSCSGTQCQFEQTATACTDRCENGACVNEPCAGVVCNMPPAATCADAQTLMVFASAGTCSQGACSYATVTVPCANGCANGACTGNPCAGKTCTLPPASECIGSSVRTYQSPGVCDGVSGQCAYSSNDTVCAAGCANGACLNDPCGGVQCQTPPEPVCTSSTARRVYASPGTCGGGICGYASATETCANGGACDAGVCLNSPTCTASNCSFGCCQGTTCIQFSDQSANVCGSGAAACQNCGTFATCSVGQCLSTNPCAVNNGGCDTNATCTPTGGSTRTCMCNPGYSGDGVTCSSLDGGFPKWVLRMGHRADAGVSVPSPRRGSVMAYDALNNLTLVFGGWTGTANTAETWGWNGSSWALLATTGPSARRLASMAYDSKRGQFVLFGGYDDVTVFSDTWVWAGSAWTQVAATGPARYAAAMVYDVARDNDVLVGGNTAATVNATDTAVWNGTVWITLAATPLGGNLSPPFTYDPLLGKPVLVGTDSAGASQTFSLSNSVWSTLDAGRAPDRVGTASGFIDGRFVVYGGELVGFTDDTQEWDGSAWKTVLSKGPTARKWPASAVDSARNRLVMFGGLLIDGGVTNETWEYSR